MGIVHVHPVRLNVVAFDKFHQCPYIDPTGPDHLCKHITLGREDLLSMWWAYRHGHGRLWVLGHATHLFIVPERLIHPGKIRLAPAPPYARTAMLGQDERRPKERQQGIGGTIVRENAGGRGGCFSPGNAEVVIGSGKQDDAGGDRKTTVLPNMSGWTRRGEQKVGSANGEGS